MISKELLDRSSRLFLLTGLVGLPLAAYELYLGLGRGYYIFQADGYHTLFDSVMAALYAVILKVAYRRSRSFPWGLYNAEGIATILVSIFVMYLVGSAFVGSLSERYAPPAWTSWVIWASAAMSITIAVLEVRYARLMIVKSDVMHASVDAAIDLAAGGVIAAADASLMPVITGSMLVVVLYAALSTSLTAIKALLGAEVHGVGLRTTIERGLRAMSIRPLRIYVARAGSFYLVQVIIPLPPETTLAKAYGVKKKVAGFILSLDGVLTADVRVVPSSPARQARAHQGAFYSLAESRTARSPR